MKPHGNFTNFAVLIFINAVIIGLILTNMPIQDESDDEFNFQINASEAIIIVKNNSVVSTYISDNFTMRSWRVVKTTLVENSTYAINGSVIQKGEYTWKVEMLERTCACSSPTELYVVEGYVSPITGELLSVSTRSVSESNYDKETCASTVCH